MNDTSVISPQTLTRDAALNTLMYLSEYYKEIPDGTSVQSIVAQARISLESEISEFVSEGHTQEEVQKEFGEDLRKVTVIQSAVENDPGLGKLVIANQSANMNDPATGMPYESGGLSACAFQDNLKDPTSVTVVFRGTGGGEWYDNGLGLSGEIVATDQQIQATEYFDYIVEQNGWDSTNPIIHVTGHSKGGNKTQFVVMTSEYSDLIVNGYSLDGQCMSPEAIAYMQQKYGINEYNKRREKLFSISADNDYVNVLGVNNEDGRLIPDDHIFFLKSNLIGIAWHFPDCYMNEDGTITAFTEQGDVSQLFQGISEQAMGLPAPIRSVLTNGAMGIAEMTLGNGKPVNGESFSFADIFAAVPLLLDAIPGGLIAYLGDEFGIDTDWLANVVTAYNLIYYAPLNMIAYGAGAFIDLVIIAKEKIEKFGEKCKEITKEIVAFIDNGVEKIRDWYNKHFNGGFQYATEHPQIKVDTFKLRDYASRICDVNRRISNLDSRLDSLYWRVGLLDLWNLMQADLMTGYSWRLLRVASYLNDTASDFDAIETELVNGF